MDKLRATGLDKNSLVVYTTHNGAWQDVYPDAGYTPFRGTRDRFARGATQFLLSWSGQAKPNQARRTMTSSAALI